MSSSVVSLPQAVEKTSLVPALGGIEITDPQKLWPEDDSDAFLAWAEPYNPRLNADDGSTVLDMLGMMDRPDLMVVAIEKNWCDDYTPQELTKALVEVIGKNWGKIQGSEEERFDTVNKLVRSLIERMDAPTLHAVDAKGRNLLHHVRSHSSDVTSALIEAGVNVNHADHDGNTPLMVLLENAAISDQLRLLINAGASVNVVRNDGNSAFNLSAYYANVEQMQALIDAGADVGNVNKAGRNAFMQAANSEAAVLEEKLDCLLPLIPAIDPNLIDGMDIAALDEMIESGFVSAAQRLVKAMRPEVVKNVLTKYLGKSDPDINAWFQEAVALEAQALRACADDVPTTEHQPGRSRPRM